MEKTIVVVTSPYSPHTAEIKTYIEVEHHTGDTARKIAFRYVYKRREQDYTELANHTKILDITPIAKITGDVLLTHVNK